MITIGSPRKFITFIVVYIVTFLITLLLAYLTNKFTSVDIFGFEQMQLNMSPFYPVGKYKELADLGIKLSPWNLTEHEKNVLENVILPEDSGCGFGDIGGNTEAKELLQQIIIEPYTEGNKKWSNKKLLRPPNGILLYGPPGTGKTMMARAIANEIGGAFINVSADLVENKFFGESQKTINAIFSLADKLKPCVIFMDEIDGMLGSRNILDQSHTTSCKTQFLSEMDGIKKRDETVIVVGATNRLDNLDPAVKRRMRLQLQVGLPETSSRVDILNNIIPYSEVDDALEIINKLAEETDGYSGSDLEELCKLAAQYALKSKRESITWEDFQSALDTFSEI